MDAIQDHIAPIKEETAWGYTPAYFLSARFNLHRNYSEHYLKKGDLTIRDINHILSRIDRDKATAFDAEYADRLYNEYMNHRIDDSEDRKILKGDLMNKDILIMAPGSTILTHKKNITEFIDKKKPLIISVNFVPDEYSVDYAFFSNNKRYTRIDSKECKVILTSNLGGSSADYHIDYNSVSGASVQGRNSLIMLLRFLNSMDIKRINIAGADGYITDGDNYYNNSIRSHSEHGNSFNIAIAEEISNIGIKVNYITPSAYDTKEY